MDYCIGLLRKNKERNAGAKAPDDIIAICQEMGMTIFWIPTSITSKTVIGKFYWKIIVPFFYWLKFYYRLKSGDRIISQHPLANNQRMLNYFIPKIRKKGVQVVALIHDLTTLRESGSLQALEIRELALFDKLISHNPSMTDELVKAGFSRENIVDLGIFDYLTTASPKQSDRFDKTVVIAGNLTPTKCGYIYQLAKEQSHLAINLYGVGVQEDQLTSNVSYKGSFNPEELIANLDGGFGLVWDGNSLNGCQGKMGEYLQFNNPHKTSLYIVSELPIIVWRKSAIATFVLQHGIGLVVDHLNQVQSVIDELSADEYRQMKVNIKELAKTLRRGQMTKTAISRVMEK